MQEKFAKLLHLSVVVTDAAGRLHTEPSSPYCDIFRKSTESIECSQCIWCAEDDRSIPQTYVPQMFCPLGFEDFEIPIMVDEQEVGYVVFGQVYKRTPLAYIEKHPELQDALSRIPIYSESDRKILLEVGSSITKLITQVSFSRARDMENHKLEIVRDIMFQLSKTPDLQRIFDSLNNQLPKLVKFDLLGVYFYDPQSKELKKQFAEGYAKEALGEDFKEGEGYAGTVAKEKKKYLIIDDARIFDVKIKYEALVEKGLNSFLIVALSFDEEFIGVIILARKEKSGFKEDVAKLVAFLAENISATIWKTRINNRLNRKIEEMGTIKEQQKKLISELEQLHEIQAELHTGLDEDKELFLILTALTIKGGLSFNRAILFLKQKEHGKYVVRGRMAIGPKDEADAKWIYEDKLWTEMKSFSEFLKNAENNFDRDRGTILFSQLNRFTQELVFGLDDNNILSDAIKSGEGLKTFDSQPCDLANDSFYKSLDKDNMAAPEFIIAPLIYHGLVHGAIYIDNKFNKRPISKEEQYRLKIYMNQAGAVLHKALMLRKRQSGLISLTYHTLQTKLNILKSNKELMVKDLGGCLTNEKFEEHSGTFDMAMSYMSDCYAEIRDYHLFALNKTSDYMHSLQPKADSFADIIDSSRVCMEIVDDVKEPFVCDFGALRKSLEELIRNSCKHSGKGNEVEILLRISLRERTVREAHMGTVLEIDYSDNGIGIPDSSKENVFDLFFTTGQKISCSGIGLADLKQKVEALRGWIRLAKQDELINNCGVRFFIEIPVSIRRAQ